MTIKIVTIKEIIIREKDRMITFTTGTDGHVNKVETNLPYKKEKEDWSFYQRAIRGLGKYL